MSSFLEICLWLFVLNLGTAFGAGIYETRMVLPQWFGPTADGGYRVLDDGRQASDTGRRFWGLVTTLPLTLLTLVNLAAAWQAPAPRHAWWLAAALLTLLERLGTFGFFIPAALRLERSCGRRPRFRDWWRGGGG